MTHLPAAGGEGRSATLARKRGSGLNLGRELTGAAMTCVGSIGSTGHWLP